MSDKAENPNAFPRTRLAFLRLRAGWLDLRAAQAFDRYARLRKASIRAQIAFDDAMLQERAKG